MSWINVYIHIVFSTKNKVAYLTTPELRKTVFQHVKLNAAEKGISLDCANGWHDHAHCLIALGKEQSISKVAQLIKGESSHWINQNNLTGYKFNWQDDYWAVGVSESHIQAVRNYIHNQEAHHSQNSFADEVDIFMRKYGWSFMEGSK